MEKIIEVQNLTKHYKEVKAVDNISLSVEKGELFGFLGENGAGKSTTINMLCTLLPPTGGNARICGLSLDEQREEIKHHIGVVYQNNCLDDLLTVRENLMIRGGLYEKNKDRLKRRLAEVAEIMGLQELLKRPFGKLSGGQKRRCEIARALMHTPDILFLDEPTTGLDPMTRKNVWEAIHALKNELHMTVFLTTHYMEEAARADHIGIMAHGHFVEYGTPFSLKEAYAKDKLRLYPEEQHRARLQEQLRERQMPYRVIEEGFVLEIRDTLFALPLLEEWQEYLTGFEVIAGSMDDVFLNVIAKGQEEHVS